MEKNLALSIILASLITHIRLYDTCLYSIYWYYPNFFIYVYYHTLMLLSSRILFFKYSSCIYYTLLYICLLTYFNTILYNILFKHRCIYLYGCQTHWVLVTCSDIPCIHFQHNYMSCYYNFVSVCFVCI